MPTVLQSLETTITSSHFTTYQPSGIPTLLPAVIQSKKTSHVTSIVPRVKPSGSPSVAMDVHPSHFPIIVPTIFPSNVPIEKHSDKPSIHPLQASTNFPSLVPYIEASFFITHVTSVFLINRPIDGPSHIPISCHILYSSVSLSQTPYDLPSAYFSPFILSFSTFYLSIHFESTDSSF